MELMHRLPGNPALTSRTSRRHFLTGTSAAVVGGALPSVVLAQEATPTSAPAVTASQVDQAQFDQTFTHHTAMANGVRLHYVMGGQGDPVVLLHGWSQTWFEWRRVMPALAEQYTVIVPDLRGLGDSDKPADGYDTRTVATDIHELVMQLGFSRIFLVGHDIGGWVAYAYAAANREEVRRLALLEIIAPDEPILQFTTLTPQGSLWHFNFHFLRDLPEALIYGRERLYLSWFYRHGAYNPAAIDEKALNEYVRCYSAEGGMRPGFEYYRALFTDIEQTKENMQTKVEMPVLALGGEVSFGQFMGQEWTKYASNVQGQVAPQAGHWIPEEQPAFLADQLLRFFEEE
jgi:pimeloyl-ACP methyl ester carboxylesterase